MAVYGWDGVPGSVRMPITGGTVNSEPFSCPKGSVVATFYVPALAGTTTLKLEALVPASDVATEVWLPLATFDFSAAAPTAPVTLDEIPESTATSIPITALGAGVLRFVASSDQSTVPVQIPMFFAMTR
jgi:hypothetical protein